LEDKKKERDMNEVVFGGTCCNGGIS